MKQILKKLENLMKVADSGNRTRYHPNANILAMTTEPNSVKQIWNTIY